MPAEERPAGTVRVRGPFRPRGALVVRPPGDKSITHRAYLLALLSSGRSTLLGPLVSDDTSRTLSLVEGLGAGTRWVEGGVEIAGVGLGRLRTAPGRRLSTSFYLGNSGTTARLALGLLSPLRGREFYLDGDESLCRRPMERVVDPLREMGAKVSYLGEPGRLPLMVRGRELAGGSFTIAVASAQVRSALLIAGLVGGVGVAVSLPSPVRDHLERLMAFLGLPVEVEEGTVELSRVDEVPPLNLPIVGDLSAAAFWLALGCTRPELLPLRIVGVGLNPTRLGMVEALISAGAEVELLPEEEWGGEPVGEIRLQAPPQEPIRVGPGEVPRLVDELPLLALVGAVGRGMELCGAGELRVKESDRLAGTREVLACFGIGVELAEDGWQVEGGQRPRAGECMGLSDHRLVMLALAAALTAEGESRVGGVEWLSVSYPQLLRELVLLGAEVEPAG